MLLIHHFNMTYFQNNTTHWPEVHAYLIFETIMYIIDSINISFYFYIIFAASQFHFNFNMISGSQYFLHIFDNLCMITMRILMLFGFVDDMNIESNRIFTTAMYGTIFSLISGMCSLPFFILERCFASYYLNDYESKLRPFISIGLITVFITFATIGCWFLEDESNTVYVVLIMMSLNSAFLVVNIFLRYWNRMRYDELHQMAPRNQTTEYSLKKRYQISENIKALRMLTRIILFMGVMNGIVIFSFLFSSFDLTPIHQAVISFILNICIFIYSFALPQIMTCCCDKWKAELRTISKKFGIVKILPTSIVVPLKDTFGTNMKPEESIQTHFDSLRNSWNSTPFRDKN